MDLGDLETVIAECDENLCGSNLSPAEVALFTAKRKEAYEALHPEARRGGDRKSNSQPESLKGFTAATAEKTGKSKATVAREASRGENVSEAALQAVKGTKLDTGAYLDRLKSEPPERQIQMIER